MTKTKLYIELTRLNKPIGIYLLALPCLFGAVFAAKNAQNLQFWSFFKIICLFLIGSVLMRSAGCILNDFFDRKFDLQVARTKTRPLASGSIKPYEALTLLGLLLFSSFLILLQFNYYTVISGFIALALALLYPLMKRITFYPQIFLGFAFNYGIIMADLAINERLYISTLVLFASAIIWTLIYDTIYAFQDIEDDLKIGVKSSAIKFSKNPRKVLFCLTLAMFLLFYYAGALQNFGILFYIIGAGAFFYESFLVLTCNYSDSHYCLKAFKANANVGILILLAIIFA